VPRQPREELAGAIHHVFARGNAKQLIYRDDADRERYLALLGRAVVRQRWRCLAYCLMDNHMHLLVETPEPNLGRGIQWLHGRYAAVFNRRHRRSGHVFQGRYGAVRMKSDAQLVMVARYVARNPVDAGLCAEPDSWPWGSHAAAAAATVPGVVAAAAHEHSHAPTWLDTARLYEFFGASGGDGPRRYQEFVALR
jgi:putative transposase